MPEDGSRAAHATVLTELLLLRRVPLVLRLALLAMVLILCAAVAQLALTAQHHFATTLTGERWALVLARGSTAATAWPGWVAAVFFAIALLRLRRGAPEPPAGRAPVEALTLTQIRGGLRREYTLARVALVLVTLIAMVDLARTARYLTAAASGDALAQSSLPPTVVEAAGFLVAAVLLALWALSFRTQLDRLGALA